jgi:hypothetical protein
MTPAEFSTFIDVLKGLFPQSPQFDGAMLNAWYGFFDKFSVLQMFGILKEVPKHCDRFPSIKQLLEMLEPKADKDAEARIIADKIWAGIERFGSMKSKQDLVRQSIGEVGWQVVENMGGWRVVCDIASYDNVGQMKAQWRESAKAIMDVAEVKAQRDRLGLDSPPEWEALPSGSSNDRSIRSILEIVGSIDTKKVT